MFTRIISLSLFHAGNSPNCCTGSHKTAATCPPSGRSFGENQLHSFHPNPSRQVSLTTATSSLNAPIPTFTPTTSPPRLRYLLALLAARLTILWPSVPRRVWVMAYLIKLFYIEVNPMFFPAMHCSHSCKLSNSQLHSSELWLDQKYNPRSD